MIPNKKVQVANGETPSADRFVSLTTHRLLARNLFVAAVVDGTGRLADDRSLVVTPDYERARRHANKLVQALGKVEPTDYTVHIPPTTTYVMKGMGEPQPRLGRRGPIVSVEEPRQTREAQFLVRWQHAGRQNRSGKRFDTEREAIAFHKQLMKEMN